MGSLHYIQGFFCTPRPKLRSSKFLNSDQILVKTQFNLSKTQILRHLGGSLKNHTTARAKKAQNIMHFCHKVSICSKIFHKTSLKFSHLRQNFQNSHNISKTQIKIAKTQIKFCQNSVQFVQNSDFTTHWGRAVSRGGVQK